MLKVYEANKKKQEDVYLKLEEYGGDILVAVCDENGNTKDHGSGNLLKIDPKTGKIKLCNGVSARYGFDLSDACQLKLN